MIQHLSVGNWQSGLTQSGLLLAALHHILTLTHQIILNQPNSVWPSYFPSRSSTIPSVPRNNVSRSLLVLIVGGVQYQSCYRWPGTMPQYCNHNNTGTSICKIVVIFSIFLSLFSSTNYICCHLSLNQGNTVDGNTDHREQG